MNTISTSYSTLSLSSLYSANGQTNLGQTAQNSSSNSSVTSQSSDPTGIKTALTATQGGLTPESNQAGDTTDSTDSSTSTSDTTDTYVPTGTTDSSDNSSDSSLFTSSVANADYKTLIADLRSGNITAVQKDESKLQMDLAATGGSGSASATISHHHASTGSYVNVTV